MQVQKYTCLFELLLCIAKLTFFFTYLPMRQVKKTLHCSEVESKAVLNLHFFPNFHSCKCFFKTSQDLSKKDKKKIILKGKQIPVPTKHQIQTTKIFTCWIKRKLHNYLAHVIEQPNFRIPNPQYFVYLLDQTVGQDTLQFMYWNHTTFSNSI